ncbi:hypothetical protein AMTRI_Chr06g191410 [Amborella trichopoda]
MCLEVLDKYFIESRQGIPLIIGRFDSLEQLDELVDPFSWSQSP